MTLEIEEKNVIQNRRPALAKTWKWTLTRGYLQMREQLYLVLWESTVSKCKSEGQGWSPMESLWFTRYLEFGNFILCSILKKQMKPVFCLWLIIKQIDLCKLYEDYVLSDKPVIETHHASSMCLYLKNHYTGFHFF